MFPDIGSKAVSIEEHGRVSHSLKERVTIEAACDEEALQKSIQAKLDTLVLQPSGNKADLAAVRSMIRHLPAGTKEKVRFLSRVRGLERKWGLRSKTKRTNIQKQGEETIQMLPPTLSHAEELMIAARHTAFIDLGREGRKWVIDDLRRQGIEEFPSLEALYESVTNAVKALQDMLKQVKEPENQRAFYNSLEHISFDEPRKWEEKTQTAVYKEWLMEEKDHLLTITQIKKRLRLLKEAKVDNSPPLTTTLEGEAVAHAASLE